MMRFEPKKEPLLAKAVADTLLDACKAGLGKIYASFDLGLSKEECIINDDGFTVRNRFVPWSFVEVSSKRPRDIYIIKDRSIEPLTIFSGRYYKLVMVKWGSPPTLEIDGIHMHRVKDITPDEDTKLKLRNVKSFKGKHVLDTCMGLGYTAIESIRRGASSVITVEVDENVIEIARMNPWSWELSDDRITLIKGDVFDIIESFGREFDIVIHDPPRISLAGHLYGKEFYEKLSRVIKHGGILIHYVGQPGIMKGVRIQVGVMRRLREVGFSVSYDAISRTVVARYP